MEKRLFVDQMGRSVLVPNHPQRIISLVPSITELLFDLGLEERIIGVTKFCVHPIEKVKLKSNIGGTKTIKLDKIQQLNPDLIIGNKEENVLEQIQTLESNFPVWMSDCNHFDEGLNLISSIGQLCNVEKKASSLREKITQKYSNLNIGNNKTFIYFIWNDPLYIAGQKTFINSMLEKLGLRNSCKSNRYPEWRNEQPDLVFLSSEPFPFKEEHKEHFSQIFPKSKILLIDGEMCSWYGSRMLLAANYFREFSKKLKL